MYSICMYDYGKKENKIIDVGSFLNMWNKVESLLLQYILLRQGDYYGSNYKSFLYKYNDSPDRIRAMHMGPFYIELDKYDSYKFVVKEKKKIYKMFMRIINDV
eukprot:TRINITY_DN8937_c0_g1_i1.p1 TRINITY_DN8937_c0_g1~~TRINITY_DN8937_c0_g1_i1.p1  ORF type:complete len:103 (+),score=12.18 TRINITY_DN8937_c0_g1_i1:14-322(+)